MTMSDRDIVDAMQNTSLGDRRDDAARQDNTQDADVAEVDQDRQIAPIYNAVVLGSDLDVYNGNSRAELAT